MTTAGVKFIGVGGHMDLGLLHTIAFEKKVAQIQINALLEEGKTNAAYQRGKQRDRVINRAKARLRERGYYYRVAQAEEKEAEKS
jgi:hypothetical protein